MKSPKSETPLLYIFLIGMILSVFYLGLVWLPNLNLKSQHQFSQIPPKPNKISSSTIKEVSPSGQLKKNENAENKSSEGLVKEIEAKPVGFCLSVPVIFYHHIEPIAQAKTEGHAQLTVDAGIFDGQMKYLKDHGYRAISAEELVNAIYSHKNLGKVVVVTLDDGYSDAYNFAFPVAKKYGVILNLMIPTGLLNNPGYMSWDNLKEMVNSGLAQAYDHTWSHYSLPRGDEKKIQMEVLTAENQLEQNLGRTAKILAYPYGSSDQKVINILQKNGFIAAFSTIPSFYQCESYIFNLRRNRIGNAPLSAYGL